MSSSIGTNGEVASEREIFIDALARDPGDRGAFLADVCAGNEALRRRVEDLLASHEQATGFLEVPAVQQMIPGDYSSPIAEAPGSIVGRYKLLEKIGEGGMGIVYMAEQQTPVRRKVALKIVKPGMDSAQVIARFEAERQALAMMDHINIAKVLDAGATAAGRPYFVMELVHGTPITTYCDDNRLTLRQRLDLFTCVCRAVQHAHQKGIIHRDIKPSNVLVTMYDGRPVPKVIDFGVAKALEQRLTEQTLFTRYGVLVGTFEYMAPEQAEMSALGADTRSDIYSLGVLLYELLTGTTPLVADRVRQAALADVLKLIRDDDPPAPSTRLSSSGDALENISARRGSDPQRLTRSVRGELDWIVMRCLEKDRSRRYETADAVALDVSRYLNDEPVAASPPSARYRLGKFARRHRVGLLAGSAVLGALVVGAALATYGLVRAREDRKSAITARNIADEQRITAEKNLDRAKASEKKLWSYYNAARQQANNAEAVNRFLQGMFERSDVGEFHSDMTVREVLDRAARSLDENRASRDERIEASIRNALGTSYSGLGLYEQARHQLDAALEIRKRIFGESHPDVAQTISAIAGSLSQQGNLVEAERLHRQALEMRRKTLGREHAAVADTLSDLAFVLSQRKSQEAEALNEEALAIRIKLFGDESDKVAGSLHNKALVLQGQGKLEQAEEVARRSVELYRQRKGERSLQVARALKNLSSILSARNDLAAAEETARQSLQIKRDLLGQHHQEVLQAMQHLANLMRSRGDTAGAEELLLERLEGKLVQVNQEIKVRPNDPQLYRSRADIYGRRNDLKAAAADLRKVIELDPSNDLTWFDCCALHLLLGEQEVYRKLSHEMLERFKDDPRPDVAERGVKIALLTPEISAADMELCRQINTRTVADLSASRWYGAWFRLTSAILAYRSGDNEAVFKHIESAIEYNREPLPASQHITALCFSAMAHHKLGQANDARRDLETVGQILAAEHPTNTPRDLVRWNEFVALRVHYNEAKALIDPK